MPTIQQNPAKHDHVFKWGGAAVFVAVILAAIALIVYVGKMDQEAVSDNPTTTTTESSSQTDTAVGSTAPASIKSSVDLQAAESSLESADLESFSAELEANEADLATF
jgi:cytoskeletal protein RodZ